MMTSDTASTSNSKKRRIMIITADESIIEQIQNNTNAKLFKSIVLDSSDDNEEVSRTSIKHILPKVAESSTPKKTKIGTLTCVVCGAAANGYNFDAISCESCKAFFRRNALKDPAALECRRNNTCDITTASRRRCPACRLIKCLNNGMKRDRLLTTEQKAAKHRKIEENRKLTLKTYEEKSQISDQPPPSVGTNLLLLNDYTDLLPQSPSKTLLTQEEIERVETIQLSFEQRIELAARNGLPWNPSEHATTFLQHINARSVCALRLVSFFKQIPEFNELNVEDRVTLIKYNLMPISILNCTLAFNPEDNTVKETDYDAPINSSAMLKYYHGQEIFMKVKKIFESFVRIAQYDQRIIQLALVILVLTKGFSTSQSSSEPILNDNIAVYRAQSYYTKLLWKYLETVHGDGKAVNIFSELVAHFISWQMVQERMHRNMQNILTPADMNEILPIMKSLLNIS